MTEIRNSGYEILQYSLCEGWVNNLYDSSDCSYVFDSIEEAVAELQEEFDDWQAEIDAGERCEEVAYDISTFQIVCNNTAATYDLGLIAGKIVVISSHNN